jgi:large subunit ribosomal protein L10
MSFTAFRQPIKTISRQRKDLILSESFDLLKKKILIFTQCNNLNSKQLDELRTSLSKSNIQMKFLKTSVFRRALQDSKYPELLEALSGPIIAWSSDQEPGEAGKALISAVKGKTNIHFLAGKIEEKIWTHEGCKDVLQNLKTKNEIQSQLLGLLQAPAANIHGILSQVPNTLAGIIDLQSKVSKESVTPSEC